MPLKFKMITLCNLILEIFHILINKFHNFSTGGTDYVIMMWTVHFAFITGSTVPNFHLPRNIVFYKDIHGSVDGSSGHMATLSPQCQVDIFAFPVALIF